MLATSVTGFRWTIKRKLFVLVGSTWLVLVLLLAVWAWWELREQTEIAERELEIASRQAAGQVRSLVEVTAGVLSTLALQPEIQHRVVPVMEGIFRKVMTEHTWLENVFALGADGRTFASAVPVPPGPPPSAADRPWFRHVMAKGERATGGFQVGRVTGKPVVIVAVPLTSDGGRPTAVLGAGMGLERLHLTFQSLPLAGGRTITVIDGEGRVLSHAPSERGRIGQVLPLSGVFPAGAGGTGRLVGADGRERIAAVAPVADTRWRAVVAVTRASLEERIVREFVSIAFPLLGLSVVACLIGFLIARRVWQPLGALAEAARRLPDGGAGPPLPIELSDEVGELARAFAAMAEDVRAARLGLEQRVTEATTMNEAGRLLSGTLELPAVLQRLTELALTRLGADAVRVWLAEDVPGAFRLAAQAGVGGRPDGYRMRFAVGEGLVGWIVRERAALAIKDLLSDPRLKNREWAEREGLRSALAVPLLLDEAPIGVLAIMSRNTREFSPSEVALAEAIALPAAIAIRNARLHDAQVRSKAEAEALVLDNARLYAEAQARARELEERNRQLATLHEVAGALATEHELDRLLQHVVESARDLVGARYAALGVFGEDGCVREFLTAGVTAEERQRIGRLPEGRGLLGHVFQHGETLRLDDVASHPSSVGFPPGHPPMQSLLAAPIRLREQTVGALYLTEKAGGFTPADESALTALCADAAIAIDNARLLIGEQERRAEADMLLQLALITVATLDEKELFRRIALGAARACRVDRCSIYVWDESREWVVPVMSQFADGTTDARMWKQFRGQGRLKPEAVPFFQEAVERRATVLIPTPSSDPRVPPEWAERYRVRSLLVVPLVRQDDALGVLALTYTREARTFAPDQIRLATTIAAQVTLFIENARLVRDLRRALDDLRGAQERLVQTETLRALGEMAAGIAHHLNNLLAVVLGRTQLLLMRVEDQPVRRALEIIERAAKDGADVVRRIQGFSRVQPAPQVAPVDLNEVAAEVLELTRPRWRDDADARGIRIEAALEPGAIPTIAGEGPALREVLVNLVLNAVDALPAGGAITVRTWAEGGEVCCAVADTGVGMSDEVRQRSLEPFFTTKGLKNTGLGLSVNYGVLRRHGGDVEIQSAVGRGTTVIIRVPAAPPARAAASPEPVRDPPAVAPLRVLVIDDEAEVLGTLAEMLETQGHAVTAATSGREALAHLDRGARIDLVITDLGMPVMNGLEVARALKRRWPGIPVVLVTGWGERPPVAAEAAPPVDLVIAKPVTLDTLADALARVAPSTR